MGRMGTPGSIDNDGMAYDWSAMRAGPRGVFSIAVIVMSASFIGFGALVRALGFELHLGLATIPIIWALPGQVLYLTMVREGAGLLAIFLGVTLSAVRLMPMAMLVLSEAMLPKASKAPQFLLAHFTAVTIWVLAQERMGSLPRAQRLPWLLGLAFTLLAGMVVMTLIGYLLAGVLPPLLAAALAFVTPVYFYIALYANARLRFDYVAAILGTVLIYPLMAWAPEYDLLIAGLVGGTIAWLFAPRQGRAGRVP
jgi:predicted branched-subunit amino acid permease